MAQVTLLSRFVQENDVNEFSLNPSEQLGIVTFITLSFCYSMTSFLMCLSLHSNNIYASVITARTEVTNINAVIIEFRLLVGGCSFVITHFVMFCSSPVKNVIKLLSACFLTITQYSL